MTQEKITIKSLKTQLTNSHRELYQARETIDYLTRALERIEALSPLHVEDGPWIIAREAIARTRER